MAQWMPLCLWALHRTIAERPAAGRPADGVLPRAADPVVVLLRHLLRAPISCRRRRAAARRDRGSAIWRALRALAAGAVLAACWSSPFTIPYFDARKIGRRAAESRRSSSTARRPRTISRRTTRTRCSESSTAGGLGAQERELFQGIAVPLLAVVGLWPPLSAARIGYAVGLVAGVRASLGFNGWYLSVAARLRAAVPGAPRAGAHGDARRACRSPSLSATAWRRLWRRWRQPGRAAPRWRSLTAARSRPSTGRTWC